MDGVKIQPWTTHARMVHHFPTSGSSLYSVMTACHCGVTIKCMTCTIYCCSLACNCAIYCFKIQITCSICTFLKVMASEARGKHIYCLSCYIMVENVALSSPVPGCVNVARCREMMQHASLGNIHRIVVYKTRPYCGIAVF